MFDPIQADAVVLQRTDADDVEPRQYIGEQESSSIIDEEQISLSDISIQEEQEGPNSQKKKKINIKKKITHLKSSASTAEQKKNQSQKIKWTLKYNWIDEKGEKMDLDWQNIKTRQDARIHTFQQNQLQKLVDNVTAADVGCRDESVILHDIKLAQEERARAQKSDTLNFHRADVMLDRIQDLKKELSDTKKKILEKKNEVRKQLIE
ncbi:MAG: hypothetical protein EZS28_003437, partial [Streblomastix strix]